MPEAAKIPIIDISDDAADQAQIARSLVDAAAEYGFVYVKSTGRDLAAGQVEKAFAIVSQGFLLPTPHMASCAGVR